MGWIEDNLWQLTHPITIILAVFVVIVILIIKFKLGGKLTGKRVLYLSESERIGKELRVEKEKPTTLYTEEDFRFIRNAGAYNLKEKNDNITLWLAKRGTAYTFSPVKSGEIQTKQTIFEYLSGLWGKDIMDDMLDDMKQKIIDAEVFITVDLEKGLTPKGYKLDISEENIRNEANEEMAALIGEGIQKELRREDWIRNIGLMCGGALLWILINSLGIIGGN